jgi:hypothetical protein
MADNAWSQSTCRGTVWWYGVPGQGCWFWTAKWGYVWVSGAVYQKYAQVGYECLSMGAPVKPEGWMTEFDNPLLVGWGTNGQWFQGGAIHSSGPLYVASYGNWGQCAPHAQWP